MSDDAVPPIPAAIAPTGPKLNPAAEPFSPEVKASPNIEPLQF